MECEVVGSNPQTLTPDPSPDPDPTFHIYRGCGEVRVRVWIRTRINCAEWMGCMALCSDVGLSDHKCSVVGPPEYAMTDKDGWELSDRWEVRARVRDSGRAHCRALAPVQGLGLSCRFRLWDWG